jgi:folate-binding protein YgfZ
MRSLPLERTHLDAGATLENVGDVERVQSYGDGPSAALRVRDGLAVWDRSHRATLRVSGPDRTSWLQGMITNDVAKLRAGQSCRAAVVTSKGRMVAEVRVHVREDELWMETSAERAAPLLAHLRRFIIMEDCTVEDGTSEHALLSILGPRADPVLDKLLGPLPSISMHRGAFVPGLGEAEVMIARSDEFGVEQFDLWVPPTRAHALWRMLREVAAEPIGLDAVEILRIEAGRPRFGAELDEDTLPLEAGLKDEIAYDKGCYIGQEIIARVTFRGHVNRELRGLLLDGATPPTPAALTRGGEPAGDLRSATFSRWLGRPIGLAYVKRDALNEGTELVLPDGGIGRVCPLPFRPAA